MTDKNYYALLLCILCPRFTVDKALGIYKLNIRPEWRKEK